MSIWLAALAAAAGAADQRPVWHYVRSNGDGSETETIVVFRESETAVRVFKGRSRCTNAAYVTAQLDARTGQARQLVGGRLTREGTQAAFAWLGQDAARTRLLARLGGPDATPIFDIPVGPRWVLYDFDFSDLIARPPAALGKRGTVRFDLPLLLVGESGPSMTNRGEARLSYVATGTHEGVRAHRYRIDGPALGGGSGDIWFATAGLHIVEAQLPIANHSEYEDFRLRLIRTGRGEADWIARLADHWKGCPPPANG